VVSPDGYPDVELVLEPNANLPQKLFKRRCLSKESLSPRSRGKATEGEPRQVHDGPEAAGPVKLAIFSDTCGNLIQMYQPPA
jgi:glyoxylase I family protein